MRVVSMLSCPIRSASREISLNFSRKFFAYRWRKEWGYTVSGRIRYRFASTLSCKPIPLGVMGFPQRLVNIYPDDSSLCFSHTAISCKAVWENKYGAFFPLSCTDPYSLRHDLNQFAYSGSCSTQKPHYKVPEQILILQKSLFQFFIIPF